jgi:hypothetical protein
MQINADLILKSPLSKKVNGTVSRKETVTTWGE